MWLLQELHISDLGTIRAGKTMIFAKDSKLFVLLIIKEKSRVKLACVEPQTGGLQFVTARQVSAVLEEERADRMYVHYWHASSPPHYRMTVVVW
jgi:hypothetical protein